MSSLKFLVFSEVFSEYESPKECIACADLPKRWFRLNRAFIHLQSFPRRARLVERRRHSGCPVAGWRTGDCAHSPDLGVCLFGDTAVALAAATVIRANRAYLAEHGPQAPSSGELLVAVLGHLEALYGLFSRRGDARAYVALLSQREAREERGGSRRGGGSLKQKVMASGDGLRV